ncbi:unnamed protein product [Rotaria magnacalcarata]|uniref:Uncharacterized protein n=3 Tax=Rotaria magnacalcarata TaxID=392030 RepID=A0A816WBU1_9BILA|nr:unnamed protein product [Rotaria magnacalcarata]CAF2135254.1 unnamed protein product [Rotaria magnacalcarata]CAF2137145.1 unnamed protein product [Rotaria magnacalcarata]CAF2172602.1 unnamed protein product [Rotaria magnacalcarata]CAF3841076.1 unnamed protein product [Rotaria magnacalcarata]
MTFARPKADANGEFMHQRYTELSDVIRSKNKVEDRLLSVRLKCYEREKKIRLNIIRQEKYQLERARTTLCKEVNEIQIKKETSSLPSWLPHRPKLENQICQLTSPPEVRDTDWLLNSSFIQSSLVLSNTGHSIRPHTSG